MFQQTGSGLSRGREAELDQVQQHIMNMQAKVIPAALETCVQALLASKPLSHTSVISTRAETALPDDEQQGGQVELYVQCCLCMIQRAQQLSAAGHGLNLGIMQEVTGLLQHELQKSAVLLHTVYCQHTHILLQHAASLDVLLRMVPLFKATQQAAVYQALCSSLPRVHTEVCYTDEQAATVDAGLVTLAPVVTHCNRQLDRFIPDVRLQTYARHDISSRHPPDPVLSFGNRPASAVELAPQLPALLALSLALPHSMHSTHSIHSDAETEGIQEQDHTCSQTASCALTTSSTAQHSTAASSPQETILHTPLSAPAESQLGTHSQQGALSQLSTMTVGGKFSSEALLPSQGISQGGGHGGALQGQGRSLAQSLRCDAKAGAHTVQADMGAGDHAMTKAVLLTQALLEPAAVLAMLGFKAQEFDELELQTSGAQAQAQAVSSLLQTQAAVSSVDAAEAANTATAATAVVTEAGEAAAGHPLTHDPDDGANGWQPTGQKGCGGSLLTLLGLGGVTEGLVRGASRAEVCEEEDARLRTGRQACIALHVVEALLDAALTKPEVMSALSEGGQASSSSKTADRNSSGKQVQAGLASTMVLQLVALHCALQAAAKKGSNSKAVRQPAYLTMDGAHGLLDLATELLTQTAQAKPQRRRTSQAVPKHCVSSSSQGQNAHLDPALATYLLSLVGYVIESHRQSQDQQLVLAGKAVALYKLVKQVGLLPKIFSQHFN